MNTPWIVPGDDELLMFHFGEDLGPERMQAIALAIAEDPRCATRYAELKRLLAASSSAIGMAAEPRAGFEQRAWRRLAPQLQPVPAPVPWWRGWLVPGLALAASVAFGIVIGRQWQPPVPPASPDLAHSPAALDADAGARMLAVRLSAHLGRTERLLRAADNGAVGDVELAQALIDSNRLYAAAAERAGKTALAAFLLELEPVLRELANEGAAATLGGSELAQEQIRSRDLLFRLRALETLQSAPSQRL